MIAGMILAAGVLLECEGFKNPGGWTSDPASMRQMGSIYLMAHGYGVPVADATTKVAVPASGTYVVWARTRNWVEEWAPSRFPGRFRVRIDGRDVGGDLGTNGKAWSWQKAGKVKLAAGDHELALHDLTGFNGRCDAVYLTSDGDVPPEAAAELDAWRHRKSGISVVASKEQADLIVVGGGMAGICAALGAARMGLDVILLQDRGVLGGCNSSEVRVAMGGHIHCGPYPALGTVVAEVQPVFGSHETYGPEYYEDTRKELAFRAPSLWEKPKARLHLREFVYAVEMDRKETNRIAAVLSRSTVTGRETRYTAPLFVDATGDGTIARLAGCEVMYGCESRARFGESCAPMKAKRQVMGHTVQWYSKPDPDGAARPFPDISDWALKFDESTAYHIRGGDWEQETGFYRDMADDTEAIRDYGLLTIFSNWNYVKNLSMRKDEFKADALDWMSPCGGKRESYRVVGDYVLTQTDIEKNKVYDDGTAAITWSFDFHVPDPANAKAFKEPFRSCAYHRDAEAGKDYPVPYRCLYARDCANLFLAGRDISLSHAAFAGVRVMRTLGMLGEVVGLAASICKTEKCTPRGVYEKHLAKLKELMTKGVPSARSYHAYGHNNGYSEKYHFKDLGWIGIWARQTYLPETVKARIKEIGFEHRVPHPEIGEYGRRRLILADESRARLHYYDSADEKAGYFVDVKKPVWDLKKVGDMTYRTVCDGGFQVTDMKSRKVVDEFTYKDFVPWSASAVCDLPDGGFLVSMNPQSGPDHRKAIRVYEFAKDRALRRIVRFEGFFNARSMKRLADGTLVLTHEHGFLLGQLPTSGEKGIVLKDFPQPKGRNLFDVIPTLDGGWLAGTGYGAELVRFRPNGEVAEIFRGGQKNRKEGKEDVFYGQPLEIANGHIYQANWTGHGADDSKKGWQVLEFNCGRGVDWYLDDPVRFGSISGIDVLEAPGLEK